MRQTIKADELQIICFLSYAVLLKAHNRCEVRITNPPLRQTLAPNIKCQQMMNYGKT